MRVDWAALGIVAVISVGMTVVFVLLLASGIRLVSAGQVQAGGKSGGDRSGGGGVRTAGFALLGCAGLLVMFGIYLILPISS